MRLFSNRTPHRNRKPLPPPRWENYTRRSFVCGALFFVFSRKNSENLHLFLENQRKLAGYFLWFVCNYLKHNKIKIKIFLSNFVELIKKVVYLHR